MSEVRCCVDCTTIVDAQPEDVGTSGAGIVKKTRDGCRSRGSFCCGNSSCKTAITALGASWGLSQLQLLQIVTSQVLQTFDFEDEHLFTHNPFALQSQCFDAVTQKVGATAVQNPDKVRGAPEEKTLDDSGKLVVC